MQEGATPDRDMILALTADEEGGTVNGVQWLLDDHRELIDAEFCLNMDGGDFDSANGKRLGRRSRRPRKVPGSSRWR